jgi:hypothetical protein
MNENCLILTNNVLYAPEWDQTNAEHKFLTERFCGTVVHSICDMAHIACKRKCMVYLTGTIEGDTQALVQENAGAANLVFCVVREYASHYDALLAKNHNNVRLVSKGKLPTNVFNVGVLFPRFFDDSTNYFERVQSEHHFQALTESNKGGVALRQGIYLSHVEPVAEPEGEDSLAFHLLRCSSNLQGPTDNFRATDHAILDQTNEVMPYFYEWPAQLNHVLAQIYYNKRTPGSAKESKATIKRHSDKTKDMPVNGMIAFATFYDFGNLKTGRPIPGHGNANDDQYDVCYQSAKPGAQKQCTSMLTQIEFVAKDPHAHPHLHPKFRVRLYPNSLLLISLETNRLYTHEIKPSVLPVDKLPTRLGYVMRCSKTKAVFKCDEPEPGNTDDSATQGQTYIVEATTEKPLHPMTPEEMQLIKDLYFLENTTDQRVEYPKIYSSLNSGDYKRPLL